MNPSTVSVVRNVLLFIPTCFIVTAQFAVAQQSTLGVDDQFAIQAVANPKLSPDEQWVAYTVRTTSIELEKSETRLWMISTSGGVPIPMTSKGYSVSNVEWGPEGGHLSFIASKNSGESQVWQLDLRGGEAQQITSVEQGVQSYEWSPDGSKLLLLSLIHI